MVNNQFDEEYVVKLVVETDEAIEKTKKWRAEVDKLKRELLDLRNKSGDALSDVARGFLEAAKSSNVFSEDMTRLKQVVSAAVREINTVDRAMDQAKKEMEESQTQTSSLGRVFETAFGFSLGTIAINAIRSFINVLKEGASLS